MNQGLPDYAIYFNGECLGSVGKNEEGLSTKLWTFGAEGCPLNSDGNADVNAKWRILRDANSEPTEGLSETTGNNIFDSNRTSSLNVHETVRNAFTRICS